MNSHQEQAIATPVELAVRTGAVIGNGGRENNDRRGMTTPVTDMQTDHPNYTRTREALARLDAHGERLEQSVEEDGAFEAWRDLHHELRAAVGEVFYADTADRNHRDTCAALTRGAGGLEWLRSQLARAEAEGVRP